jgi:hypothetical protein
MKGIIMKVLNNPQVYMEPGTYWCGDLCYVMGDRWDEFCKLTIRDHDVIDGGFTLQDGTEFVTFTTKYGDGTYYDKEGRVYPVDAGLIGCIRVENIDTDADIDFGNIITFDKPFVCERVGGMLYFGKVAIDLDPQDLDESEDEEEYDDE